MKGTKIITPADAPGLIVGNTESRMVRLTIEFEGACPSVMGDRSKVERIRDESGRWVKAVTIVRRIEALGGKLVEFSVGERGPHAPIY